MASAPPDPASQETDRRRQAEEAAALALLLIPGRRYSLPSLIAQQRIRPRPFRQIRPTAALKYDLAAPYYDIVRAWSEQIPALTSPIAVDRAASIVQPVVEQAKRRFPQVLDRIEKWHRQQWITRTKAATGLDVSMFTQPGDVADALAKAADWNSRLADDVTRQIQHNAATELLTGGPDVEAKIKEAVAKAKRRSAAIGDDQVDKVSRAMDRQRRVAAGVTSYVWHHTEQLRPRPHHKARNGKTFANDEIDASDQCGVPPFCKCWEEPRLR